MFEGVLQTPAAGRQSGTPGHTSDALIAHTALVEGADLVTAEGDKGRMRRVPPRAGITTWSWDDFAAWVLDQ